ncbi:DUF885 domain-containing protein [Sphingomonas jatrophae]|uniref:Uncharacterized conserved protein, DUF885 familyt n=1 Tax=Sphingomonas jatrophae TaxID=1166337 RepID=A0A1I6KYL0_9SPHN|nr:DUF885 domain-containing protein [Sphingomonas jatrophae]SFR96020.1 Uncharacterized conserved protein, DUF885 familyt [Sphingomonas jatrophae]
MRLILPLALLAAPAAATPSTDLASLIERHWAWYLEQHPILATSLGERRWDDRLPDLSLAGMDRAAATASGLARDLRAVPDAGLSPAEQADKAILLHLLDEQVEANRYGERMILWTSYASFHQDFTEYAGQLPFRTAADHQSWLKRLAAYPDYVAQGIATTRAGVAAGYAQPCAAFGNMENTITGLITPTPETSRYYAPFAAARPATIPAGPWEAMQARAKSLIAGPVTAANRRLAAYYRDDYLPHCRKTLAAEATPDGRAAYAFAIRRQTTTTLDAERIHAIGLGEVARIDAAMAVAAKRAGYPQAAAFKAALRSDRSQIVATQRDLLAAAALQAKTIDGMLPRWFSTLPRLPYGIKPIPAETAEGTTTAYYGPGNPQAGKAGTYWVNTSRLDQRPLYELPALTAHEAVPGHHLQIALQQELDLKPFRRFGDGFNAFVEGWALYSERLGEEMGLYDTPAKAMGRLSYEMWRACRLVVDTGIHHKGWSKAQAIAYMREHTALSDANIEAEVNRYISWPGQALGYKLGELEIVRLRQKAEAALGDRFDLPGFHQAVLGQGSVPLGRVAAQVDAWIARVKQDASSD